MPPQPHRIDRRLPPNTIAQIVDSYRSGASTNQLCKQYGLSKGSMMKVLRDHDVPTRFQPMTSDEIDSAVALYAEEYSLRTISLKLGKSKGSVWKALYEHGVSMRPPTR